MNHENSLGGKKVKETKMTEKSMVFINKKEHKVKCLKVYSDYEIEKEETSTKTKKKIIKMKNINP